MSGLLWLIENYPEGFDDEGWDMNALSSNKSLPIELIEKYPKGINGKWNMRNLSLNPTINSDFVRRYIDGINDTEDGKWSLFELSQNPSIDFDFVENYRDGFCDQQWNIINLCMNPNITEDFIIDNINEIISDKSCMDNLSANPMINEELYLKYNNFSIVIDDVEHIWRWDYNEIASNPSIRPEFLLSLDNLVDLVYFHQQFVRNLSKNINLTPNFLKNNLYPLDNIPWDMYELSRNPAISLDFVMENPRGFGVGNWVLSGLYENPSIDSSFFIELGCPEIWDIFVLFGYNLTDYEFLYKYFSSVFIIGFRIYRSVWNYFYANYKNKLIPTNKFVDLGGLYMGTCHNVVERSTEILNFDRMNNIDHNNLRNNIENLKCIYTNVCSCEYILNNPQGYDYNGTITPWSTKILSIKSWINSNININRPNKK